MSADQSEDGAFSFTALPVAVGLAIAIAIAQTALLLALGFAVRAFTDIYGYRGTAGDALLVFMGAVLLWTHALFVMLVSDTARPTQRGPQGLVTAVKASIPLTIIFGLFLALDSAGAAYGCGDGRPFRHYEAVPMLPWLWIGWSTLTLFAVPARLLGWVRKAHVVATPIWLRIVLLPLGAAPVWLFGYVFQNRTIDCSVPHEGWGLLEGGVFVAPLFGAFLFTMCTSMAMLSAAFVRSAPPREHARSS